MKIKVDDLPQQGRRIDIKGDEDWLAKIYRTFPEPIESQAAIKAQADIVPDNYGFVTVTGHLTFAPNVNCSRCDQLIPWPLERQFNVEFRPANANPPKEIDLEAEELEYYYLDEAGHLDLEIVLNDTIQTAFPAKLLCASDDGQTCKHCHIDLNDNLVYHSGDFKRPNPFSVLKNIKTDS
jgi:uncharacterized metal-binding protein YceD (DUF177 family)